MPWDAYGAFLVFAVALTLAPGPDFAVVTKNTLAAGRRRGLACAGGVATSNAVQGTLAAAGLSALIVRVEPLFQTIRWAGVAYLTFLGVQALRSALRGQYDQQLDGGSPPARQAWAGWRQGFLSNITNPKVLVFYLAVLPQFLGPDTALLVLLVFALSHAVLSLLYLQLLVTAMRAARRILTRRRVRRSLDTATGTALLGFGVHLATQGP